MFLFLFFSQWQNFLVRMHFCIYDGQRERDRVRFKSRQKSLKQKRVVCKAVSVLPVTNLTLNVSVMLLYCDWTHSKLWGGGASFNVGRSGGKEEEGRGVVSEMAGLHNLSERQQKESEEKWKARKERACYLCLAVTRFLFQLAERGQTSLQKFVVFISYRWKGVKQLQNLGLLGGPCSYPRSKKEQTHRHTPSLSGHAHTRRQTVKRKRMWGALLPVEY